MSGMDRHTGRAITGLADIHQSVTMILTSRPGDWVHRRDLGCGVPDLIDAPATPGTLAAATATAAAALHRWEPRVRFHGLRDVTAAAAGAVGFEVLADFLVDGRVATAGSDAALVIGAAALRPPEPEAG